ncbi:unnamed protein product [Linum trigynum]|uniref:Uncharacterized protein n=1 Tax=Linum trigynum TaxID=586398 RepID=A0AAV2CL42_9ROSI
MSTPRSMPVASPLTNNSGPSIYSQRLKFFQNVPSKSLHRQFRLPPYIKSTPSYQVFQQRRCPQRQKHLLDRTSSLTVDNVGSCGKLTTPRSSPLGFWLCWRSNKIFVVALLVPGEKPRRG